MTTEISMLPLPTLARELLHTLLDRYEQPNRQTVVRVAIDAAKHAAYFDRYDVRESVNATLKLLADQEILTVHYVRRQEHLIDKVDLNPSQAAALYKLLGRTPQTDAMGRLRTLLSAQAPQAEWLTQFLAHSLFQLDNYKSVAPFDLDDDLKNRALLAILVALADLTEPTLERVFSVRVLNDSKRFGDLRNDVLRVLRKFSPHRESLGEDEKALLAAHFIERVPEHIWLAGPLTFRINGDLAVCQPFYPSIALPASLLRPAQIDACEANCVLTIENTTSFVDFCRVRPVGVLAIFTGGFASPTLIQLLTRLIVFRSDLRLYHWGDLDVGGLRILRHLRQSIGQVQPVLMDVETLMAYGSNSQPLEQQELAALKQLRDDVRLADCGPLIDWLVGSGNKLEQEAIPAERVVSALHG